MVLGELAADMRPDLARHPRREQVRLAIGPEASEPRVRQAHLAPGRGGWQTERPLASPDDRVPDVDKGRPTRPCCGSRETPLDHIVGEIDGVEQLTRYLERLALDPRLGPLRGMLVAQAITPQARTLAESRGIQAIEVDYDGLRDIEDTELRLFDLR